MNSIPFTLWQLNSLAAVPANLDFLEESDAVILGPKEIKEARIFYKASDK
jgi:hypothetical protein